MPNLNTGSAIYIRYRPAWFKMGNHLAGTGRRWFIPGSKRRRTDFPSVNDIQAQRLAGARRFAWWGRLWPAHFLMGVYMRNLLLAATAALSFAVPAAASPPPATYNFALTGSYTANWSMPASPTPNSVGLVRSVFDNITFTLPGNVVASYQFAIWNSVGSGGIRIDDPLNILNSEVYAGIGDEIYTGTLAAPTFKTGTFTLNGFNNLQNGTLTISAVPEPSSWAMLIAGFGLTGAAMRRRRTSVAAA